MANYTKIHMQVSILDLHKQTDVEIKKLISAKQKHFEKKVWQKYLVAKRFGK